MNRFRHRLALGLAILSLPPLLAFTVLRAPPRPIAQVSPPPDATGVWPGTPIQVNFTVAMDRASVESRLVVDPPVAGTFVWWTWSSGETVEFRPDDILAVSTAYRVTLQAGVRDATGQVALDADYTWSFTTRQAYPTINFGYGIPVQLVDPDGRNRVQFWAGYPRIRVNFALYGLATNDFAARYGDLRPGQDRPIDVTGLPRVAAWQQAYGDEGGYTFREAMLPAVPSGVYVLVASHPYAGQDEMYVVVSRTVLALKRGAGRQVVAWAMRLQNQTPVNDLTVTLYDAQGASIAGDRTDATGVVELDAGNQEPRLAVGQADDQVTVAGLNGAWRTDGGYWYWWWDDGGSSRADTYRVYLYTDRPIYRPGHTVHFAAILRHELDGTYTPVEASHPVTATLRDSRNNVVATQVLTPDTFGSVSSDFTLAAEPPMGTYHVELSLDGAIYRQEFRVEAYRKPEYQVDVTTLASYAVAGDAVPVTVEAGYFFGQPVAGADVVLKVFRRIEYWYWWPPGDGEQIAELRGITDGTGRWTTTFTTDRSVGRDAVYTFVATVTDASRQPVTGRYVLPVHWNTFRLALTTEKYGYQSGEPVVAQITTRGHDGTPVAGVTVTVTVWRDYPHAEVVAQQPVTTTAQGQAQASFAGLPQGWYRIEATAVDGRGRPARSERYLWIYDRSGDGWWYPSDAELSISADQASYAPGDTAQLLIQSRVTGMALLTLERGAVYQEQVVRIDGPATTVDLPIGEDFAPNVFARIHIFKPGFGNIYSYYSVPEGRLVTAQTELVVSAESHRLSVGVTPDAAQYRPGDQATFTIQVTNAGGEPVEAQVGLALVDEAIFALSEDLSGDIFATFYGQRPNGVTTYDSLAPRRYYWDYREQFPGGTPTPTPAPTGTPSPAATPTPASSAQAVRREFRDTAYWNPSIHTGPDGRAVVTVDLPDNLTTWRVIARAVTLDTRVGDTRASILVTQEIIARPALPRFTILGDRFALDTIVQNYSGQNLTGTASLDAPHLVVLDPGPRSVELPNLGTAVAHWSAVAAQVGVGTIGCAVDTPAGRDAIELPLRTQPFAVPERWMAAGQANPVTVERFTVPFNAVHEASEITLRLSPSVALGVLDGLDALIAYPYGCVEQTMSRVLPSAVAARAYRELGIPNPKAEELPEIIHQGLQRLYGFQHEDGSWGWWYDDEGSTYMTAYVLFGLTMVQQAGFDVDPAVLARGFTFLDARLRAVEDPRVVAYALYVKSVAGRGDLAAAQALLPVQDKLDPFARAALALTLHAEGDPAAAQALADYLIAQVVETPSSAYWPADQDARSEYYWRTMSSAEKNTAMALRALAALRPDHRLLPKAVRWLMDHRRGAGWQDTQATAFAVLGLVDYLQVSGELHADYDYTVALNGQVIAAGRVTSETVTTPIAPIVIPGSGLRDGENELRIERDGPGQLYYTLLLRLEMFYDGFEPVSSIDQGLEISRTYRLVEVQPPMADGGPPTARSAPYRVGDLVEVQPTTADGGPPTARSTLYRVGDLVEVQLTLEARDEAWYVIVEDPLPAGFEALNERMNPVGYGDIMPPWRWYEWGYNRKDIYDDRVVFFVTRLWPGRHVYTYLMRATTPGEFSVLPAQAYPMYAEEVWGRSASHQISVEPEVLAPRPALAGDFNRDCQVTTFDIRQVVGAWRTANRARDLDGDGDVDIRDVAVVAGRQGATCLADREVPGVGAGRVEFAVTPGSRTVPVGRAFNVDVVLADAADLGGFELTLTFDPTRLRVAGVTWNPALAEALLLGPRMDNQTGRVAFGVAGLPAGVVSPGRLATVTFVSQRTGPAEFGVGGVQAMDSQGRTVEARATVGGRVTIADARMWFPIVRR